jgi:hypothetical protein
MMDILQEYASVQVNRRKLLGMGNFDTTVSPIVRSWMDALAFDDFEGEAESSARESFWREMRTTLLQYNTSTIKNILFEHSEFIIILLNHLALDTFEENRVVWSYACECTVKFVRECGALVWPVTRHAFSSSDILDSIFDVLSAIQSTLLVNFDDFDRANSLLVDMMRDFEDWSKDHQKKLQSNIAKVVSSTHPTENTDMGKSLEKIVDKVNSVLAEKLNSYLFGIVEQTSRNRYSVITSVVLFYCQLLDLPDIMTKRPKTILLLLQHVGKVALCPASIIEEAAGDAVYSLISNMLQTCSHVMLGYINEVRSRPVYDFECIFRACTLFLLSGHTACRMAALNLLECVHSITTNDFANSRALNTSIGNAFAGRLQKYIQSCSYDALYFMLVSVMHAHRYFTYCEGADRVSFNMLETVDEVHGMCLASAAKRIENEDNQKEMIKELIRDSSFTKKLYIDHINSTANPPAAAGPVEVIDLCDDSPPDVGDTSWLSANASSKGKGKTPHQPHSALAPSTASRRHHTEHVLASSSSDSASQMPPPKMELPHESSHLSSPSSSSSLGTAIPKNPFKRSKAEQEEDSSARVATASAEDKWVGAYVLPSGKDQGYGKGSPVDSLQWFSRVLKRPNGESDSKKRSGQQQGSGIKPSRGSKEGRDGMDAKYLEQDDEEALAHVDDWRTNASLKSDADLAKKKHFPASSATDVSASAARGGDVKARARQEKTSASASKSRAKSDHDERSAHEIDRSSSKHVKSSHRSSGHSSGSSNTTRVNVSGADSMYSLDVHGEFNTGIDLDIGYETLLPQVPKAEDMHKPKRGIDIASLFAKPASTSASASVSTSGASVTKITVPAATPDKRRVLPSPMSPSIKEGMSTVSIDPFFLKLLTLPLASFLPTSTAAATAAATAATAATTSTAASSSKGSVTRSDRPKEVTTQPLSVGGTLNGSAGEMPPPVALARRPSANLAPVPTRFINEQQYIRIFQPLLEAELEASLLEFVRTEGQGISSKRDKKDGGRHWGGAQGQIGSGNLSSVSAAASLPKVTVRCAMLIDRLEGKLVEARVATVQEGDRKGYYGGASLLKDDLIIIVHPDNARGLLLSIL